MDKELIKYGKCWLKPKKLLEEMIEYNKGKHSEVNNEKFEIMLEFMETEKTEIGE